MSEDDIVGAVTGDAEDRAVRQAFWDLRALVLAFPGRKIEESKEGRGFFVVEPTPHRTYFWVSRRSDKNHTRLWLSCAETPEKALEESRLPLPSDQDGAKDRPAG